MLTNSQKTYPRVSAFLFLRLLRIPIICLCLLGSNQPAKSAVTWSGDVVPENPMAWTSSTSAFIGYSGNGTLDITDGSDILSGVTSLGLTFGYTGTVTVKDAGSTWTNSYNLCIGEGSRVNGGSGELNILNGGLVSDRSGILGFYADAIGTVTVDGPESTWINTANLTVGNMGSGELNITAGGTVTVAMDTLVASYSNSSGTIYFENGTLQTGNLFCGADNLAGTGTIITHGLVSDVDLVFDATHGPNQSFLIEQIPGQNITVQLNVDESVPIGVGYSGVGTMSISDGRVIESTYGYAGYKSGSLGEITVRGAGSEWNNSESLTIGYGGNGKLNITNGGSVTNDGTLYIGSTGDGILNITNGGKIISDIGKIAIHSGTGKVTVNGNGSIWTINNYICVGSSASPGYYSSTGDGELIITGGGAVRNENGYIGDSYKTTGKVTVDGAGSIWINNSNLCVGKDGDGVLSIINSGLVSVAGTLSTDKDEDGDAFINMAAGGMLALHGDADDSLSSFLGLVAGTDAIRYWNYTISDWADIQDATLGDDYTLSYTTEGNLAEYTVLTINTPAPTIVGDANHDGLVNAADAAVLARYWQKDSGVFWGMGDFNDDGVVNDIDAVLLAANWTGSGSPSNGSVPEPSGIAGLLALCLAGILTVTRQKKRMIG